MLNATNNATFSKVFVLNATKHATFSRVFVLNATEHATISRIFERAAHWDRQTYPQKGPQSPIDISELKYKLIPGIFKVEIEMTYYWKLIPETFLLE